MINTCFDNNDTRKYQSVDENDSTKFVDMYMFSI